MNFDNGDNLSSIHPLLEPLHAIIFIIIGKADTESEYGIVIINVSSLNQQQNEINWESPTRLSNNFQFPGRMQDIAS